METKEHSSTSANYLMKCGHAANATTDDGKPCCVVCIGITEDALTVVDELPSLAGRKAICLQCDRTKDSSYTLPFFTYRPDEETDLYYCGCRGWD